MRIGIDIDGVINDLERFQIDYGTRFNYENNIVCTPDFTQYKLSKIFSWDRETCLAFHRKFSDVFFLGRQYIRPLASPVIGLIAEMHDVYLITARPSRLTDYLQLPENSSTTSFTKQWLSDNDICYEQLIFTSVDKWDAVLQNGIGLIVEDNPEFLAKIASNGIIPVFCYNASYNESIQGKNLTRVFSWYDILTRIRFLAK